MVKKSLTLDDWERPAAKDFLAMDFLHEWIDPRE